MENAHIEIATPAVPLAPGGLFAVAGLVNSTDPHAGLGFRYVDWDFGAASVDVDRCDPGNAAVAKTFDNGLPIIEAKPFTIYKGLECSLWDFRDNIARARRGLEVGEQRAVEAVVWERMLAVAGSTDITPTPGTAVSPKRALGLLEGYLGANYSGVGVLHVARGVVPFWPDLQPGNPITTMQATLVANGAGYAANTSPAGVVAAAGQAWVYGSGHVHIERTGVFEHDTPVMVENRSLALAERIYSVSVEGPVAAVLVNLEG